MNSSSLSFLLVVFGSVEKDLWLENCKDYWGEQLQALLCIFEHPYGVLPGRFQSHVFFVIFYYASFFVQHMKYPCVPRLAFMTVIS